MKLLYALTAIVISQSVSSQDNSWSWDRDKPDHISHVAEQNPEYLEDFQASPSEHVETSIQLNSTSVEKVIDQILSSTREGKALNGFDEVYSDPNIQDVLQKGDEGEARNLIKERLCYLGLMQCEENIEGKRPYIAPEELVYAQPVAINPVGKPIPTIPLKGVRGSSYGSPKPIHYQLSHSSGPPSKYPPTKFGPPNRFGPNTEYIHNKPPRRHYGPPPSKQPGFIKPPLLGEFYDSPDFLSKPSFPSGGEFIDSVPPYKFEQGAHQSAHHKDKRVEITVNAQGGTATSAGGLGPASSAVEHVHHHYHHNLEGQNKPTVVVNPIPIAAAAVSSDLSSSNPYGPSNTFGSPAGLGGFSSSSGLLGSGSGLGLNGGFYGGKPTVNYGGNSYGSIKPVSENYGAQTFDSFGTSVGSYGSTGLYKKELNINSINNNYLQPNYADKYQGVDTARAENYDCICVPYDQCPSHDVIGRKDDLYLPLDPRSLKSDIEALPTRTEEERVITDGNGTMTVIRVQKDTGVNTTVLEENREFTEKKISKREAPADHTGNSSEKAQGRQYGGVNGLDMKKIKPTFGVSFGLPHQGGGGYPINPFSPNSFVNPYGGTIGGGGINLGLVSVNPLISVQVTRDDYGNKEIKPFVNLHVTPNNYLVHKFEDLLAYKKHIIFNKHKHYHLHKGHPHYYGDQSFYKPPYYHHGPAEIYDSPVHSEPYLEHHPSHPPSYSPLNYHRPDFHPPEHHADDTGGSYFDNYQRPDSYYDDPLNYGGGQYDPYYGRAFNNKTNYVQGNSLLEQYQDQHQNGVNNYGSNHDQSQLYNQQNDYDFSSRYPNNSRKGKNFDFQRTSSNPVKFPSSRKRRDVTHDESNENRTKRQFYGGHGGRPQTCGPRHVCCKKPYRPNVPSSQGNNRQCGTRHSQGINGRIKNPVYVDGDSEFGEYPWQVAILKKDPKESVYVCGGTLIDPLHVITAAHCVKTYTGFDLRVRLGEWDVNHDVEFYPYIERDIVSVHVHPEFYAGTLYNDIAILRMEKPVDWSKYPHISPACLPHPQDDYTGARCWTTGWGKDAFGDFGKYQNILKEVDVPVLNGGICQRQLQNTRLGYEFKLHPGFICAGGEEGKDACKGDGGGPMVCERGGTWQVVGIVSWGIGCGQVGVPGVYVRVSHYLDWIRQITQRY